MKTPEITAPAGNLEKVKMAINYGAEAIYLGGPEFSLRQRAGMSRDDIALGVAYAHQAERRVYAAVNIFARNDDFDRLPGYLAFLTEIEIDAVIVSDPGIIRLVKREFPNLKIHLSTQMNVTNLSSLLFWAEQGVSRVVLARELGFGEIEFIKQNSPVEIEIFVHGAVCISYSGRCYLSQYMINRNANRGECAHPCRWRYTIVEEKRPGQYYEIEGDERGAYIQNSRDLCLLGEMPKLIDLGLDAWKIEGRVKGIYYLGAVIKTYREARDAYLANPDDYHEGLGAWLAELDKTSHRPFFSGADNDEITRTTTSNYLRSYQFVGLVKEIMGNNLYRIEARNQVRKNERVEIINPYHENQTLDLVDITDTDGAPLTLVQPNQEFLLETDIGLEKWAMLRKPLPIREPLELKR